MANKQLLINISGDLTFISSVIREYEENDFLLLDVAGVTPPDVLYPRVFARELDEGNSIERQAIEQYVQSIGELSAAVLGTDKSIRDFTIQGLPVFWVTDLAQKHPFNHWALSLYYLIAFADSNKEFFQKFEMITIISSLNNFTLNKILGTRNLFRGNSVKLRTPAELPVNAFPGMAKQTFLFCKHYFSGWLRKIRNKTQKQASAQFIQVSVNRNGMQRSPLMPLLNNYLSVNGNLFYCNPADAFYGDRQQAFLLPFMPGPVAVLRLCWRIWTLFFRMRVSKINDGKHFLLPAAIHEMKHGLQQIELFFYHDWLIRFFKSLNDPAKIFFEDELYKTGRIISHAAIISGQKQLQTFGYQHGNIAFNHTVYRVGKLEMTKVSKENDDKLPFPDYFLMWGSHFRKQMMKVGGVGEEKLLITGSLQHIMARSTHEQQTPAINANQHTLLWCTTSATLAAFEYSIMKGVLLSNPKWQLVIRMHPLINIEEDMKQLLDAALLDRCSWNNAGPLTKQASQCQLVVCSAHSSVFLDCINLDIPTVRIFTPFMFPDMAELNSPVLFNVFNAGGFSEVNHKLSANQLAKEEVVSELIYNKDLTKWDSVLAIPF